MGRTRGEITGYEVSDDYTSLLKVGLEGSSKTLVWVKEEDEDDILYKILASNDDLNYETVKAETPISQGESDSEPVYVPWRFLDVQVKNAEEEGTGVARCFITEAG